MKDEEYREGLEDVRELAKEVHLYAKTAWSIVGHRPRLFGVSHETTLRDEDKELWLNIGTWSGETPHCLYAKYSESNDFRGPLESLEISLAPGSLSQGPTHNMLNSSFSPPYRYVKDEQRETVLRDLKDGLAQLFAYIQAECKRGFVEHWGSVDAERRWDTYDQEFVERVNSKRLLQYLEGVLKRIYDAGGGLAQNMFHGVAAISTVFSTVSDSLTNPARLAIERMILVKQANLERRLFVD